MKRILTALAVALVAAGMAVSGSAVDSADADNTSVTVEVDTKTAVDISPSDMSWTSPAISPGDRRNETDDGYYAVEIENIGSENITSAWLNTTTPSTRPFASGQATEYDAGNFVQVNATGEIDGVADADDSFTYVNRKEFNESGDLSYVFVPDDGGTWKYGRFRSGDQEHFWAVNTSGGNCETTGTEDLRVGRFAHNKTNTGSTNFRSGGSWYDYELTGAGSQAYAPAVNLTLPSGETRNYTVVMNCADSASGTFALRSQYNVAPGELDATTDGSTAATYVFDKEGTESSELQPGEFFRVDTRVEVPQGVASGTVDQGLLRVYVNTVGT